MKSPFSTTRQIQSSSLGKSILLRDWASKGTRGRVLMLHGLGDHSAWHDWAAGLLTEAGYTATSFDWPGNGGSEGNRGDMPTVEETCSLLDEILITTTPNVIGIYAHSTGGFLLLSWLSRQKADSPAIHTLRWLWLSSPLLRPSHNQPKIKIIAARSLAKFFPHFTLDSGVRVQQCFHSLSPSQDDSDRTLHGGHHRISLRFGVSLLHHEVDLWEKVRQIDPALSILVTQGADDSICPPKYTEQLLACLPSRKKTWIVIADARHEPFREKNALPLLNAIRSWLR